MLPADNDKFSRLLQRMQPDSTLLDFQPLTGGVSAQVTRLEVRSADGEWKRLVVRRHGSRDLASNPQIATHEFALLQRLHDVGLAVPRPLFVDASGEIFPDPVLVLEYIEGTAGFPSAPATDPLDAFVTHLARLHAMDHTLLDIAFLPQLDAKVSKKLPAMTETSEEQTEEERQIREALRSMERRREYDNPSVLLHGDYWWGNTLWEDGELVAVIDWENAAIGDPLADLANTRLEILWTLGQEDMERFTRRYRTMAPHIDFTNLPFWDLLTALHPVRNMYTWGLDPQSEQTMRAGLREFIRQAIAAR